MIWLTKYMLKSLLFSVGVSFTSMGLPGNAYRVCYLNRYNIRQIGNRLINRGWIQVIKKDEHVYTRGQHQIVINFELQYVCVYKIVHLENKIHLN